MKKLSNFNFNTPEEFDEIFVRNKNRIDDFDWKRWKQLLKHFNGGRLVDMGAFYPHLLKIIKQKGCKAELYAVDYSPKVVEELRKKYPQVKSYLQRVEEPFFGSNFFDYVVAGELLEHLDDPAIFIKEAMRILKPKGWIAISVPHKETMAGEVDGKNHLWSFDKEDLFGLLKNYGRVKIKILGSQHFPRYKYKFPSLLAWCQKND